MTDAISIHGIVYVPSRFSPYKYELVQAYEHPTPIEIRPSTAIDHPYMALTREGMLTIKTDYAWDGASGPVRDTPDVMRASLVHDALYQMIREKFLPRDCGRTRREADVLFGEVCIADGMSRAKAKLLCLGLRLVGAPATWRWLR